MFGATVRIVICFVLISFVTGCSTMRALPTIDAQSIASELKPAVILVVVKGLFDYGEATSSLLEGI